MSPVFRQCLLSLWVHGGMSGRWHTMSTTACTQAKPKEFGKLLKNFGSKTQGYIHARMSIEGREPLNLYLEPLNRPLGPLNRIKSVKWD